MERGLVLRKRRAEGLWAILVNGSERIVSLDSLLRNYERDAADVDEAIDGFIDELLATRLPLPEWEEARAGIRYCAEKSELVVGHPAVLADPFTPKLSRLLVYTPEDEHTLHWLTREALARWGVGESELHAAARENMAALQERTPVEVKKVARVPLAVLRTHSAFKASLLLGPSFRAAMEAALGWPVLIVIPCRDSFHASRASDTEMPSLLWAELVREYLGSGYSLTNEVLLVSDEGIRALGEFSLPKPGRESDD
ncbi:hypothetical protein F0U61_12585 [Archangium violaceum]|uniref:hypothetical protein n=1 Tax=Archangium violaceum TaxID=83451 RepID=UPI002B2E8DD3|nr:hypothetical protein F0U61_12585 [Archangium violaceum]